MMKSAICLIFLASTVVDAAKPSWCTDYTEIGSELTETFANTGCTAIPISVASGKCAKKEIDVFGSLGCQFTSTAGHECCVIVDALDNTPFTVVNTNSGCINPCDATPAPSPFPTSMPTSWPAGSPTIPARTPTFAMPSSPTSLTPQTLPPLPPSGFRTCASLSINSFPACDYQCDILGMGSETDYQWSTETIDGRSVSGTSCTCEGTPICIEVTSGGWRMAGFLNVFLVSITGILGLLFV